MDQIQKFLDLKEPKIKMSSLLNVSNVSNEPEKFNLKDIEVFVDSEEQNWFEKGPCEEIFRDKGYSDIIE